MEEETDIATGQVTEATAEATPAATEVLAGEGEAATKATPEGNTEGGDKAPINLDEEVVIELANGKTYTMKRGQAIEALEKHSQLSEKEKAIVEKEKSLNRDYTQKSQANAEFRKTVETTFGRFPAKEELNALGKIWSSYFKNPQAKQLIDRVLSGQFEEEDGSGKSKVDPYVRSLEAKLQALEEKYGGLTTSLEEKETQATQAENMRIWGTWAKGKETQGIKITQEVDSAMAPFVRALRMAQPDWTPEKVLDEAYKHATIDQIKQTTAKETLISADKAKKQGIIKVTPKGGGKSDTNMSYKDILREAANA